ncbi:hypothetical protein ACFX2I_037911 [Malus domestica]
MAENGEEKLLAMVLTPNLLPRKSDNAAVIIIVLLYRAHPDEKIGNSQRKRKAVAHNGFNRRTLDLNLLSLLNKNSAVSTSSSSFRRLHQSSGPRAV